MANLLRQALVLLTAFVIFLSLADARKWNSGFFTTIIGHFSPTRFDPWNMKTEGKNKVLPEGLESLIDKPFLPRATIGEVLLLSKKVGQSLTFLPLSGMNPKPAYVLIAEFGPDFKWRSVIKKDRRTQSQSTKQALLTIGYVEKTNGIQVQVPDTLGKNHFNARVMVGTPFKPGFFNRLRGKVGTPGLGYRFTFDAVPLFLPKDVQEGKLQNTKTLVDKIQSTIVHKFTKVLKAEPSSYPMAEKGDEVINFDPAFDKALSVLSDYLANLEGLSAKVKKTYCKALLYDDLFLAIAYPGAENAFFPERFSLFIPNIYFGWQHWISEICGSEEVKRSLTGSAEDFEKRFTDHFKRYVETHLVKIINVMTAPKGCPLSKSKLQASLTNLKKWELLAPEITLRALIKRAGE